MPYDEHYSFMELTTLLPRDLLLSLAETHETLANLYGRIGFLKAERVRDKTGYSSEELPEAEAQIKSYEEKKWLLVALLRNFELSHDERYG